MACLRVLTLNIWNRQGPWPKRLRLIQRALETLEPDVIGLQEVMRHDEERTDQARDVADGFGYHVAYGPASQSSDGTHFGNAVLSRFPFVAVNNLPLPAEAPEEMRALLHVDIDAPCGRIPFFTTHLDWKSDHSHVRVRQVAAIMEAVNALAPVGEGFPAVLVGDFNADPDSEEVRYVCETRAGHGASAPFADCFAVAGDGTPGHTFARSNRYAAKGCARSERIDYIFSRLGRDRCGEPLRARVVCTTPQGGVFPSDHYGVYAEIRA